MAHVSNPSARFTSAQRGTASGRRYAIMLEQDVTTPEYLVSPGEEQIQPAIEDDPDKGVGAGSVDRENYSYATLSIDLPFPSGAAWTGGPFTPGPQGQEWRDTANTQAILISDRAIADTGTPNNIPATDPGHLRRLPQHLDGDRLARSGPGSVLRNDGSVGYGTEPAWLHHVLRQRPHQHERQPVPG